MIFQHYTVDDFQNHQHLLAKRLTHERMVELVDIINDDFRVDQYTTSDGISHSIIETNKPNHLVLNFGSGYTLKCRNKKYNSIKAWLSDGEFPVLCNLTELREEYPHLSMMSDVLVALFVYAQLHPGISHLSGIEFPDDEDATLLFAAGYQEYGIASEWNQDYVKFSKIQYLVKQGRTIGA